MKKICFLIIPFVLAACHNVVLPVFTERSTSAIEEKDKNVATTDILKALEYSLESMLTDPQVLKIPSSKQLYMRSFKNMSKLFVSDEDIKTSFERIINPSHKFYISPPVASVEGDNNQEQYFVSIELTEAVIGKNEEKIYQIAVRLYDNEEHIVGIWRDNIRQLVEDGSWW